MQGQLISLAGDIDTFHKKRISVFAGAYGSGKTEISINIAARLAASGRKTRLVDVDVVKPLFRSRDASRKLDPMGVRLVSALASFEMTDLPALSPEIAGAIEDESLDVVVDLGGDAQGARTLGRFRALLEQSGYEMLYVINTLRPFSESPAEIVSMISAVEQGSRLKATGLVSNTNLGAESAVSHARHGLDVALEVGSLTGLEVKYIGLGRSVFQRDPDGACRLANESGLPVFVMDRFMLPPWEDAM